MLMHGVYLGGVFWAIHQGMPAGLSALIVGLQPLITAVLAGKLLGEEILPRHWAGLAAGFAGVVIVLLPKLGALGGGVTWPRRWPPRLSSVAGMSAGTIWQKRFAIRRRSRGRHALAICRRRIGDGVGLACASRHGTVTVNGELVFAMAWLVLVLSIGAIFLLMVMIRDGEMSKVASLFYLVPAVTALIAWALFGEELTLVQIVGMAIATLGVGAGDGSRAPARSKPLTRHAGAGLEIAADRGVELAAEDEDQPTRCRGTPPRS